jgi:hypothetical protein
MQFSLFQALAAFKKNLYTIYGFNEDFSYYYLLAILNSRFFSNIQVNLNTGGQRDDYPAFSLKDFRNVLIPITENQEPFVKAVKTILSMDFFSSSIRLTNVYLKTYHKGKIKLLLLAYFTLRASRSQYKSFVVAHLR